MGLSTLVKELTAATHVMQSTSNKLSTSVANSVKCKQTKVDTYVQNSLADIESHIGLGVCHQLDVKLGRFQSWLGVPRVYVIEQNSLSVDDSLSLSLYIYIYICSNFSCKQVSINVPNKEYLIDFFLSNFSYFLKHRCIKVLSEKSLNSNS